jgi:hypothetical protein
MNAQRTRQTSRVAGVLASLLLVAGNSQAAAVCSGQPVEWPGAMTVNDMTFGSSASAATAANACAWLSGNKPHKLERINAQWRDWLNPPDTGRPFVELAKWDVINTTSGTLTPHTAFGFSWTLALTFASSSTSLTSGTYTLTASAITPTSADAVTLPHIFDFVGVLKGGSGAGSWFFNDRLFDGSGGGTWQINFRNEDKGNGKVKNNPDLSNLTIFARSVGSPPPNGVPTPGTLPLVGLALLAGWVAAARRRSIARA